MPDSITKSERRSVRRSSPVRRSRLAGCTLPALALMLAGSPVITAAQGTGEDPKFSAKVIDMTTAWTNFVVSRLGMFRENREPLLEVHGADTVESLDVFYATVVRLFRGGRLGGVRLLARLDPAR